jgi:hypothetical protein
MDWPTIITIVLGSSVLGTAMTIMINWYSQIRERGRYNSFLALTLSHAFEKYAHSCLDIVSDDELYRSSGGHAGNPIGTPPKPFDLPAENFRDFDINLLDSIFEFPQKVSFATDEVVFIASVVDADEAHDTSFKNTVELANHAISLADRLRNKYNLHQRVLRFGEFDLRKELKKKMQ